MNLQLCEDSMLSHNTDILILVAGSLVRIHSQSKNLGVYNICYLIFRKFNRHILLNGKQYSPKLFSYLLGYPGLFMVVAEELT